MFFISISDAVDICVAIDRSDTITEAEWADQLEYVANMAAELSANSSYRLGLVSFDTTAFLDIALNAYGDLSSLQNAIRTQPYGGSGRDISKGLFRMHAECFTALNGQYGNTTTRCTSFRLLRIFAIPGPLKNMLKIMLVFFQIGIWKYDTVYV